MKAVIIAAVVAAVPVAFATVAHGAATPMSPAPGAVVSSSHPVFTWAVPASEESSAIYVATAPDTTPEGRFYDENVKEFDFFTRDEREWSPSSAQYAGNYWWIVRTTHRDTYESAFSAPSPFTIPPALRIASLQVRRRSYTFIPDSLDLTVRWTANVRALTVTAAVFRKSRRLWRATETETNLVDTPGTSIFDWTKPRRIRQGTRLRLTVTIRSGTAIKTIARSVLAP